MRKSDEAVAVAAELQRQLNAIIGSGQEVVPTPPLENGADAGTHDVTLKLLVGGTFAISDEQLVRLVSANDRLSGTANLTTFFAHQLGGEIMRMGQQLRDLSTTDVLTQLSKEPN